MKRWLMLLLVPFVLLSATEVPAAPAAADTAKTEKETKRFYTTDEVSSASAALSGELDEINASMTLSADILQREASLPAYIDALEMMRSEIEKADIETYSINQLARAHEQATLYREQLDQYEKVFEKPIERYNDANVRLKELEAFWVATLENAVAENAPEAIVERINASLVDIVSTRERSKQTYDNVLTYMDMAISEQQKMDEMLERLEQTRSEMEVRLFVKDSEPMLVAISEYTFDLPGFFAASLETVTDIRQTFFAFYRNYINQFYIHTALTLGLLGLMLYLYYRDRRGTLFIKRDSKVRGSMFFVRSPVAATVILSVLMIGAIYPERPVAVAYANVMIALVALLLIIYRLADTTMFRYALLLSMLFAVGDLLHQFIGYELDVRLLWFVITIILLLGLYNLLRPGGDLKRYELGKLMRFIVRIGAVAFFLLGVSLIANFLGFYHLALKLVYATLISMTIFMAFTIVGMVFNGLITMFVRRRSLGSKHLLEEYALQIESNLKFIANGFLLLYWIYLVLQKFEISYFVEERFTDLMALAWQIGDVTFSVRSMFNFVIVLVVTSFMTRFVRIVLDLEVFSRYELPRGVPTAIQMMVRYLIITVGILLSLSVLGIKMGDLSLLAGALGVGIGFGLRNIMANFVSGVLMIFERPVQQGDVVEVDKIFGDVQRIGVRATTIKTYDGSEVIVPNADFITKEVTNWTLSSKLRRVKMAYKVAFGNDPREIIRIMQDVITHHPDVREDPAPKVLFEGYGDYYLEFTVYFWVEERLLDVKSETAIAIYEALTEAGVKMPVPQSQVRYEGAPPRDA